jgi:hypothetical protein
MSFSFFLPKKNSCDIYKKVVTNSLKNSSADILHSITSEKIEFFIKKKNFYEKVVLFRKNAKKDSICP